MGQGGLADSIKVDCTVFRSGGMAHVSQRTGFNGSALVCVLSRLTGTEVRESGQATADRLSQWFGWTDAISLSAALNGGLAPAPAGARASSSAEEGEYARVRTALKNAIAEDGLSTTDKEGRRLRASTPGDTAATTAAFKPYRQRYLAQQQAMESSIAPLRSRLRAALAARSPAMARLAAVDVVMEQVLGARERSLLTAASAGLARHFERLRQAAQASIDPGDTTPPGEWLDLFCKDMQDLLLAELDFRMQPIEGLLEALRMRPPDCHE
ncbi:hypothetical protein SRS16CHR_03348 [Variovorax sp. SRS16]|nr:hypothetical protein SRS16CHR_03348 [Variovorax sp. SRS16]